MWAYTHGNYYDFIAIGNHEGDLSPDLKPGVLEEVLRDTLLRSSKGRIELIHPILTYTVERIGVELREVGIPWDYMYSCYWTPNCGYRSVRDTYRCPGCRRKTIAMKAAGELDTALLDLPNSESRTYQSELAELTPY